MRALAASLAVLSAGCYHDLSVIECQGPEQPAHCADTTSAGSSTGTSTQQEPGESSDASTSSSSTGAADGSGSTDTSSSGAADTSSSSTGAEASCGDGVLQGASGEECDDGNLTADDGCNLLCKRDRTVFVTSAPGFHGGMLQGLKGADNYCVSRAAMAGFPDYLNYRAFLSDSKTDAVDRLYNGEGRYVLVDGTVVADDWQALLSQPLQHPIELTELGELSHVGVWTGTRYGDGRAVPGSQHCDDWTSKNPDTQGHFGTSDEVDINWTESQFFNPNTCLSMYAIYCIEQQ